MEELKSKAFISNKSELNSVYKTDTFQKQGLISIIIPLFNEENTIENLLKQIPNHYQYEIIVVNDGSTDESVKRIKQLSDSRIKLINHRKNLGYGEALLTGFDHVSGEVIVTIDSDGQHDPNEIPKLIQPILNDKADLVIGSRYLGKCHYKLPIHTKVGETIVKFILNFLYNQSIKNNQSGFRAFNRKSLKYLKKFKFKDWGFSTDILFQAGLKGFELLEVPVNVYPRIYGKSRVNLLNITKSITLCIIIHFIKKVLNIIYSKLE